MKTSKIQCGYRSNDIYTGEDNESLVVISDLGDEGALYVSTKPLNSYTHIEVDLGRI